MAIQLPPSTNVDALVDAIRRATLSGEPLVLMPGVHLTKPGVKLVTKIGPKGLVMAGTRTTPLGPFTVIQRPDFSIGTPPQNIKDNNYGLYFVPSRPSSVEGIVFREHPPLGPNQDPFEFGIIQQGDIEIGGFELDCNMRKQHLKPKEAAHSFMLGFSGASYKVDNPGPGKLERRVFVAFHSVTLRDIKLLNGGFSDDVRIEPGYDPQPPGYFRPNIASIKMTGITGNQNRVNGGNSIRFGGLSQKVTIDNCDLDSLILEFDEDWSIYPGPEGPFQPSGWNVAGVKARVISFNAGGDVQTLTAQNLDAHQSFTVDNAAGKILDSRLALLANDVQLAHLRELLFENCAFTLPQKAGRVGGLDLRTKAGKPFFASFKNCSFTNSSGVQAGQLIRTEAHKDDPTASVTADFENCKYPSAFATDTAHVAILDHKGDYTFLKADLAGLDTSKAIIAKNAVVTDQGATVRYQIP